MWGVWRAEPDLAEYRSWSKTDQTPPPPGVVLNRRVLDIQNIRCLLCDS